MSDSVTCGTLVCRSRAMAGKAGKYMSMLNGPNADSAPNIKRMEYFFLIDSSAFIR